MVFVCTRRGRIDKDLRGIRNQLFGAVINAKPSLLIHPGFRHSFRAGDRIITFFLRLEKKELQKA